VLSERGFADRPPREETMLEATARREKSHAMPHYLLRATSSPVEIPRDDSECLSEPSLHLLPCSTQTAHLLVVGDGLRLMAQQLSGAFPGPTRRVHFAGTGRVGIEHVRTYPTDVILLDLRLPDQSGLEVYQQIRCIDPRIPVIFVSNVLKADAVIAAM